MNLRSAYTLPRHSDRRLSEFPVRSARKSMREDSTRGGSAEKPNRWRLPELSITVRRFESTNSGAARFSSFQRRRESAITIRRCPSIQSDTFAPSGDSTTSMPPTTRVPARVRLISRSAPVISKACRRNSRAGTDHHETVSDTNGSDNAGRPWRSNTRTSLRSRSGYRPSQPASIRPIATRAPSAFDIALSTSGR